MTARKCTACGGDNKRSGRLCNSCYRRQRMASKGITVDSRAHVPWEPLARWLTANGHDTSELAAGANRGPAPSGPCTTNDCDRPAKSRGMCNTCYWRWWRNNGRKSPKGTRQHVAGVLGIPARTLDRMVATGSLRVYTADRIAITLGTHPAVIWGWDYYADLTLDAVAA